jgi:hypothetical protein
MFATPRSLFVTVMVAMIAPTHAHADDRPLGRAHLASIQEATRDLAREVEFLQDIVAEQSGKQGPTLYRQADAVLADIVAFQKSLIAPTPRERLDKAFDKLDGKLHEFLKAVQALGPEQRPLQRAAGRVSVADEELHFALAAQDSLESRAKQLLERQTRAMVTVARHLDETAGYTGGTGPGRNVLLEDLHKLAEATEQFQKGLAAGKDRPQLRKDFAAVDQAWEQAARGFQGLQPGDNMRLIRAAGQLDRIHERLYRLLGIEGERHQLILRT